MSSIEEIRKASEWNSNNKERRNNRLAIYRENNRDRINEQQRNHYHKHHSEKYNNNPNYRIRFVLRARIRKVLKKGNYPSTEKLLGCSMDKFRKHLESKFTDKMNWNNYGSYWHIDHIKPCALFDLSKVSEQKKCFHYTNLQPLEAKENMRKHTRYDYEAIIK